MFQKLLRAAVCITVVLGCAGVAAAQEHATLLLKSGERVTGNLVDMTGRHIVMTVNGQERRVPIADAAVLDFGGNAENLPAAEVQKASQGQNLLVLKDGQQIEGKLYDVGGTHPLRITFTTAGQPQKYNSDQVGRIYLAAPGAAVATSGAQTPAVTGNGTTVHVAANRAWTPTGITVQKGQVITFSSSGQVQLSADPNDTSPVTGRTERQAGARASMPGTLSGALLGRVGNGTPFGLGNLPSITAPASGPLYLGVNDDVFTDNAGEFVVTISGGTTTGTGVRRR